MHTVCVLRWTFMNFNWNKDCPLCQRIRKAGIKQMFRGDVCE